MWILKILALNLAIVFAAELPISFAMGARTARKIITVVLINIITNPTVVLSALCMTLFFAKWQNIGVLILELFVFFVEGFMFSKFKIFGKRNAYLASLLLNIVSFVVGEVINIFL